MSFRPKPTDAGRWAANLGLLTIAALWGGTFVMVKEAVAASSVMTFLAARFAIGAVALAPFALRARPRIGRSGAAAGALLGLLFFAGYALQTAGLTRIPPGRAGFVTGLYVPLVPAFAWLILRRRPNPAAWLGIALATVGLGVLSWSGPLGPSLGDLMVLGGAVAYALHVVLMGRFAPRSDPATLAAVQCAVMALVAGVAATVSGDWARGFRSPALESAAFMGLVVTALLLWLQTRLQQYTPPTDVALVFATEPVFAALAGWWLVSEQFTPRAIVGCMLILAGMLAGRFAPRRRESRTVVTEGADVGT